MFREPKNTYEVSTTKLRLTITGGIDTSIALPSDVDEKCVRTSIKNNILSISAPKRKTSFISDSGKLSESSMHRVLEDSQEKWEAHVNLSNEIAKKPNSITVIVRSGQLVIYVDRTQLADGWIYDKIDLPRDIQYKAIQTGIKGNVMMISAPKVTAR